MENYKKQMNKVIEAMDVLMGIIEDNENVKEYLIEAGLWEESYQPEFNVLNILEKHFAN